MSDIHTDTIDTGDPVAILRRGIAELAEEDRGGWLGTILSERLTELLNVRERLDAEILRVTGQWGKDRAWGIDGSLSPRAWLTHHTPVTNRQAGKLVKEARLVTGNTPIAAALADGDITTAHVETISRVVSAQREELLAEHTEVLVQQARDLPLSDFTTLMRRWAALTDDQLAKDEFAKKWERRHLHASVGLDGWVTGEFYLDPAAGATLLTALDHLAPPDPEDTPDGPRSLPQRRADALCDLTNHYLNGGKPQGNPPNINTIIDIATLTGQTPQAAMARCEIEGVGPVARTVLEQIGCDAALTRIIMAGESDILDMGRSRRDPTPAQRRAVTIRDRHCCFASCDRKPQWCDIHHVDEWVKDHGPTNLDNLILPCRRHHTLIHNADGPSSESQTDSSNSSTPPEDHKHQHGQHPPDA